MAKHAKRQDNHAKNVTDAVRQAGAAAADRVSEDLRTTQSQWESQLSNDMAELKADERKDAAAIKHAAYTVTHPSTIPPKIEAEVHKAEQHVEHAAHVVSHPAEIKEALLKRTGGEKEAFDQTQQKTQQESSSLIDNKKLPLSMKIYGVLCVVSSIVALVGVVLFCIKTVNRFEDGTLAAQGVSTMVVSLIYLPVLLALTLGYLVLGVRLLRNERRFAALWSYALYLLILAGAICSLMLDGVTYVLGVYIGLFAITVAVQSYLDPTLHEERRKYREKRARIALDEAKAGTLGRDTTGRGYISLNFFNLFWIFVVCSIIGLFMEEVVHYLVVAPGQWQDRAGLLFGPFSPIYGVGAVLMTLALNRMHDRNIILIFLLSAIIGGAFEFFVSCFMQYTFGAVAWNYTGQWLSIDGRTCGWAMGCWGLLGVVWIKVLLPFMLRLVNFIPWNWRYAFTTIAAALMIVNAVMSLQALDCWYERVSGHPIDSPIQQFYEQHFDNTWMENRFQSMTVNPSDAVRGGK